MHRHPAAFTLTALAFWQGAGYTKSEKRKRTCGEEIARMEKNRRAFGVTARGETVESWTLENEFLTAEVLTYGASLRRRYGHGAHADAGSGDVSGDLAGLSPHGVGAAGGGNALRLPRRQACRAGHQRPGGAERTVRCTSPAVPYVLSRSSRRTRYTTRTSPSRCCGKAKYTATARCTPFQNSNTSPSQSICEGAYRFGYKRQPLALPGAKIAYAEG